MINDRDKALIQAGVDGELDDSGQEALRQLLEESDEARHFHSELNRLAVFLDKIPDQELPEGLHARILTDIKLPKPSGVSSIFSFTSAPRVFRYGFAAAAALVLTVAVLQSTDDWGQATDVSNMAGTIARGGPSATETIDRFSFDSTGAAVDISLAVQDGQYLLDLKVDSDQPVSFAIDLSESGLELSDKAQPAIAAGSLTTTDSGEVHGKSQGQQQFVVFLDGVDVKSDAGEARIDVKFFLQGQEIDAGVLRVDG